jgi:UDP:flavonoid glycosyltransferase YjiC (YdhE family)
MGYYALLVPAYTGHLNPMAALALALQRRDHRVALIAPVDGEKHAREAGLAFIPIATRELPPGAWDQGGVEMGKRTGLKATGCAVRVLARFTRGLQRDLPEIHRRERFDGLIMDQIALGAEGVCEVLGLPLGVACNSLPFLVETGTPPMGFSWPYSRSIRSHIRNLAGHATYNFRGLPVLKAIMPYRLRHRLGPIWPNYANFLPPSLVQVAQLPDFLDFPRRYLPNHFHYTGPWIEPKAQAEVPFPWERLNGRPLIYASLGTLQNRLEHLYDLIAQGCAGMETQLVLSLGRRDVSNNPRDEGSTVVVGYAPQLAILQRASLVITHGGLNTTLEALALGLPLVLLPIANDQPGIAARVKRYGAGEFVGLGKLTATTLRRTIQSVLNNPSYRDAAAKCAHRIACMDGPARAAELFEQAFTSKRPVYRAGLNRAGSSAFSAG